MGPPGVSPGSCRGRRRPPYEDRSISARGRGPPWTVGAQPRRAVVACGPADGGIRVEACSPSDAPSTPGLLRQLAPGRRAPEGGPAMRRGRPGRPDRTRLSRSWLLAAAGCAMAPPVKPTSIASGAVGGIYQPIAEAIARIARETPGLDLPLTVESTGASVANVQLLGEGKVQLALVQNDIAFYAHEGTTLPAFRGQARSDLRAIVSIYPEYRPGRRGAGRGDLLGGGIPGQARRARTGGLGNGAERDPGAGGQRAQGHRPRAGGAHRHGRGSDEDEGRPAGRGLLHRRRRLAPWSGISSPTGPVSSSRCPAARSRSSSPRCPSTGWTRSPRARIQARPPRSRPPRSGSCS